MPQDRGPNAGVTGLVDWRHGTPAFTVEVHTLNRRLTLQKKSREGRGGTRWVKSRAIRPGGMLLLSGLVSKEGFPLPDDWTGQEGSITLQFNTGATETVSVRVMEH